MKINKRNKIIAAILCLVVVIGILLVHPFANEVDIDDIPSVSDNSTISGNDIESNDNAELVDDGMAGVNTEPTIDDVIDVINMNTDESDTYMTINQSGAYTVSDVAINKPIVIESGDVTLTIQNVDIKAESSPAIMIKSPATLNLEVVGTNNLVGAPGFAGICVEPAYDSNWNLVLSDSAKLNISGDGTLTAIGGNGDPTDANLYGGGAGIGGNGQYDEEDSGRSDDAVDFGIITITDNFTGTLNVTGGSGSGSHSGMFGGGAGIGSGGFNMSGDWDWGIICGEINICSGTINAYPTDTNWGMGAGIGGGSGHGDSTIIADFIINISGGNINATGGYLSAGIGGGGICDGGIINISGGTIVATGGEIDGSLGGAGIGGGNDAAFTAINITGGNITATGTGGSAGIGGGTDTQYSNVFWGDMNGEITHGNVGTILISGLDTVVTAYGGTGYGETKVYGGSGIGSGYVSVAAKRSVAMDIKIKYGATVTAYGGLHSEAIGYGYNSSSLKNPSDNVSYTGYGITLELDDSITLWAVNDDYYKPALVAANEYDGAPVQYGDIKYVSDDIYLTTYTDDNVNREGDISEGIAIGQLKTDSEAPRGVNITWKFNDANKLMDMDIDVVTNVPEEALNTPFSALDGNWATLYPAPIHITYEWVGSIRPSDVTPPTTDFVVKGTEYIAKSQDPTELGYFFDGWYLDSECTNKFVDGTKIITHTILYGKWTEEKPEDPAGTGLLTVTKKVAGNGADKSLGFNFTVTLDDININGLYGEMEFIDGKAEFTLKHGDKITASNLPTGIYFEVKEKDVDNYTKTSTGESGYITNEERTASFINTLKEDVETDGTGTLIVTKTVKGTWGELDKEFTINIELDDKSINQTFNDITFVNGGAKFKLKSGESKKATGLPAGIKYSVAEDEANKDYYKTSYVNKTGTIVKDEVANVEIINYRDKTGNLSINKKVTGLGGNQDKKFEFIITLSGSYLDEDGMKQDASTLNKTYDNVQFVNGVANILMAHNETCVIKGLPATLNYSVEEKDAKYYTTTSSNKSGMILADSTVTTEVSFVNNRDAGSLVVSKTVSGSDSETNRSFSFKVTLDDTSINGKYGEMEFKNGVSSFTLKSGNSIKATNLPEGIKYSVVETDYDGYTVTVNGSKTDKVDGTIVANKTIEEKFNNHKDKSSTDTNSTNNTSDTGTDSNKVESNNTNPISAFIDGVNTGDSSHIVAFILMGLAAVIGIIALVVVGRKNKK